MEITTMNGKSYQPSHEPPNHHYMFGNSLKLQLAAYDSYYNKHNQWDRNHDKVKFQIDSLIG